MSPGSYWYLGSSGPSSFGASGWLLMLASGVIALVLGVLFEARVTLGEVAVDRFAQDSTKIEELRRNASWLRVDGNLVAANEQANRADDLEALAKEQREYAASMSGLSFPIFLLNTTLVLVATNARLTKVLAHRLADRLDGGTGNDLNIGRRNGSGGTTIGEMDFSASPTVNITARDMFLGVTNGSRAQGTLKLGTTNTLTIDDEIRIGDSSSAGQAGAGLGYRLGTHWGVELGLLFTYMRGEVELNFASPDTERFYDYDLSLRFGAVYYFGPEAE